MFIIGQFVRHADGRRGVVINRGSDGAWYTVSWLKGDIGRVVPFNVLTALAPHGHDRKSITGAIDKARKAQIAHDKRVAVQLELES